MSRLYRQTATTQREITVSGIKKAYAAHLANFKCHVQPLEPAVSEDLVGGFGKDWLMFCACLDIKEGDKVIVGSDEYRVSGVENFNFGQNPHMEILIRAWK